jgi:hypothetical protein
MTTDPADDLDPTQPFSLSDLFDDDEPDAMEAERAAVAREQELADE